MYSIIVEPEASVNIDEIEAWYEDRREGLGDKFLDELEHIKTLLTKHPKIAQAINTNTRQRPISQTFPYNIIYQIDETQNIIRILAIRHQKRMTIYE